jgi:hypothetical protein
MMKERSSLRREGRLESEFKGGSVFGETGASP